MMLQAGLIFIVGFYDFLHQRMTYYIGCRKLCKTDVIDL